MTAVPVSDRHCLALLLALRRDPLGVLTALRRDCGPLVEIRTPIRRLYLLSEPDAIQEALTRTHHGYEKGIGRHGRQPLSRILGQGLLTSGASVHRRQRRLIQPMFHGTRTTRYADVFVQLAEAATRPWVSGEVRDLHRDAIELTLKVIARAVLDIELDADAVATIQHAEADNQATFVRRLPAPFTRQARAALRDLDALVERLIEQRRAAPQTGEDVLSMLIAARNAETGAAMPDRLIRDEAMTLLLAGHETTANALAWAFHLLAAHPEAQQRMRAELAAVLADRTATADDAARLTYTAGVWHETLRMYPPAWLIARRLTTDRTIAGHRLAAGSMLLMSPWVVHRDPSWWNDPETFRPERWIKPVDHPRQAYLPFGAGVRQCIGNRFADLEGLLTLATMLRNWRIRHPTGSARPVPLPQITLRPRDGMPLIVEHDPITPNRLEAADISLPTERHARLAEPSHGSEIRGGRCPG